MPLGSAESAALEGALRSRPTPPYVDLRRCRRRVYSVRYSKLFVCCGAVRTVFPPCACMWACGPRTRGACVEQGPGPSPPCLVGGVTVARDPGPCTGPSDGPAETRVFLGKPPGYYYYTWSSAILLLQLEHIVSRLRIKNLHAILVADDAEAADLKSKPAIEAFTHSHSRTKGN